MKPIRSLLLSAGLGTRLRPITFNLPKCLVEINGKPILKVWIDKLKKINAEKILINTHYLSDQVDKLIDEIKNNKVELFHYSNEGECSWFDFASEIFRDNSGININPIKSCDYPTQAIRPIYSVLNKDKIKISYNLEIPYWKESLERCKNKLGL